MIHKFCLKNTLSNSTKVKKISQQELHHHPRVRKKSNQTCNGKNKDATI
jgi:hypothetical protein